MIVLQVCDRSNIFKIVNAASKDIFIPITVGGGLRNLNDIKKALDNGEISCNKFKRS